MKAGRELDRLIATDVFGWKWDDNTDLWIFNHCLYTDMDIPYYSTDIADAWLVVEKLQKNDWEVIIESRSNQTEVKAKGPMGGWISDMYGIAGTAPLAICLAALKAVGVDVE